MDTRKRIIERARELFTARSYHATGVQEICQAADVKKGSFYHFFSSKHELALAVLDRSAALFSREVFTKAFRNDVPPLERIERFFVLVADYHDQARDEISQIMGCPFANIAAELDGAEAALRDKVNGIFAFAEQHFCAALDEAVVDGSLACNDTASAASAMFAYAEGLILFAKTRNDASIIRTLGRRAIRLATAEPGGTA